MTAPTQVCRNCRHSTALHGPDCFARGDCTCRNAEPATRVPWLVFCGTTTSLVEAIDATDAFEQFNAARLMAVDRDEVAIRPLAPDDAPWIIDAGLGHSFAEALTRVAS